ncbi:hypothetical protein D3C77_568160 [compost metagenome]
MYCDDFFIKPALRLGHQRTLMTAQGIGIDVFARQAVLAGKILCRCDHVQACRRIVKGFPEKILERYRRTELETTSMVIRRNWIS